MAIQLFYSNPPSSIKQWLKSRFQEQLPYRTILTFNDSHGTERLKKSGTLSQSDLPSYTWYLAGISFGKGITSIGDYCLYYSYSLNSIEFSDTVQTIGNYCFMGCTSLNQLTIPSTITSIGTYAFQDCTCLQTVTICGENISIEYGCFSNCYSLTTMNFNNMSTQYVTQYAAQWSIGDDGHQVVCYCSDGVVVINGSEEESSSDGGEKTSGDEWTVVTYDSMYGIPDETCCVTGTLNSWFHANGEPYQVKSIDIGTAITNISDYCFSSGYYNMTNIHIGNSVQYIGWYSFMSCSSLARVTFDCDATSGGFMCFSGCYSLTEITFARNTVDEVTWIAGNMGIGDDGHQVVCYCSDGVVVINASEDASCSDGSSSDGSSSDQIASDQIQY